MTQISERPWQVHLDFTPGQPPKRTRTFATAENAYGWALGYIINAHANTHIAIDLRGGGRMLTMTRIIGRKVLIYICSDEGYKDGELIG